MKLSQRSFGASVVAVAATAGMFLTTPSFAETAFTVNGVDVDSSVVDLYFETRLGGSAAQPTAEQREALMDELRDIYLLSTVDSAVALEKDPRIAAQLEIQRRGILAQAVAAEFFENTEVSDAEMRSMYDEQLELMPPLDFKARHILVQTQSEANDIIRELDGGADFAELAKEKSTGPTGPNGGDLDWFSPGQMVAPFSDAVAALENGKYTSAPVQTQFGWHVILREDSKESVPPTFESAQEEIRKKIQNDKFQAHLESLRGSS